MAVVGGLRRHTNVAALVWDGAPSHRAAGVREAAAGLPLIEQPSAAPELNPAERVFQELRRAIEGEVYPSLEAKVAAVEARLTELEADRARVQRLAGWSWIRDACDHLPSSNAA